MQATVDERLVMHLHECAMHQREHGSLQSITASHVVVEENTVRQMVLTLHLLLDQVYCQPVFRYRHDDIPVRILR